MNSILIAAALDHFGYFKCIILVSSRSLKVLGIQWGKRVLGLAQQL